MPPIVTDDRHVRTYPEESAAGAASSSAAVGYWLGEGVSEQTLNTRTIRLNEETIQAIADAETGKNLTEYDSVDEFFDSLDET
jgi:hypothetical protein